MAKVKRKGALASSSDKTPPIYPKGVDSNIIAIDMTELEAALSSSLMVLAANASMYGVVMPVPAAMSMALSINR